MMENEKNRKKLLTNFGWFGIVIERLKQRKICPSGGIGRRTGLKILRGNTRTEGREFESRLALFSLSKEKAKMNERC